MESISQGYYVYFYRYPKSMGGAVFYIGKGKTYSYGKDRIDQHEREARGEIRAYNAQKVAVIREIWDAGEEVVKEKVAFFEKEEDAYLYEWGLINMTTYTEQLTNVFRSRGCHHRLDLNLQKYEPFCIQRYQGTVGYTNHHLATYHKVSDIRSFCASNRIKQKMLLEVLCGKSDNVRGFSLVRDCSCAYQSMKTEREYTFLNP